MLFSEKQPGEHRESSFSSASIKRKEKTPKNSLSNLADRTSQY